MHGMLQEKNEKLYTCIYLAGCVLVGRADTTVTSGLLQKKASTHEHTL